MCLNIFNLYSSFLYHSCFSPSSLVQLFTFAPCSLTHNNHSGLTLPISNNSNPFMCEYIWLHILHFRLQMLVICNCMIFPGLMNVPSSEVCAMRSFIPELFLKLSTPASSCW